MLTGSKLTREKRSQREADDFNCTTVEVNNMWRWTSTPKQALMSWCSTKNEQQFAFTATLLKEFKLILRQTLV